MKAEQCEECKEGELIIYHSSDIERTPVTAVYNKRTRRLDISGTGGISGSFIVHRCHVPFKHEEQNFDFELKIATNNDKIVILHCKTVDEGSAVQWINIFSPDPVKLATLLGWTLQEIEFRRINVCEHISNSTTQSKDITFLELLDILDNTKDQEMFKTEVVNTKLWNVIRLERLVQQIFRVIPGPVIPYDQQPAFIELGRKIFSSSEQRNTCTKMLLQKVPDYTDKILKLLCNHVTELMPYLNRNKSLYDKSKLMVWKPLAKHVFRTHKQNLNENEEDILINDAAVILENIRQYYLEICGQIQTS